MTRWLPPTLAALAMTVSGCTPTSTSGTDAQEKPTVAPKIGQPKKMDLTRVIEQPASIEPFEETPLIAHITGYVEKDLADIGKKVRGPEYDTKGEMTKPGEVLATLWVPDMLRELDQKKALVTQAKADLDQAIATHQAAEANVISARAQIRVAESGRASALANHEYWKKQLERIEDIVRGQALEKQVRDETMYKTKAAEALREEVEAKVQSAQAAAKEAEARRDKAKADIESGKARVAVAEAAERQLAALVEYRFLRAPFDGVVTRRHVNTGHFLQPGTGKPNVVFVVARTDLLRIVADIPEADAGYITSELTARIQPPVLKDFTFESKITRTSETLDSKSRTLRIEVDYPNKDGKLRPGMFANLTISINLKDRWTLPASAIFTHADQPHCWRCDKDGKALRTPLKLGVREGQTVEVLKMQVDGAWQAVSGSEQVVIANLGAVSEGKQIAP